MFEVLLGLSLHYFDGFTDRYNSVHPHIRYSYNNYISGVYYNSIDNLSLYGGYSFEINDNSSIEAALVTGYDFDSPVVPMIRYVYEVDDNSHLFISPTVEKYRGETNYGAVIGIEIPIK